MNLLTLREILTWCLGINYALLIFWFLTTIYWSAIYDLSARWFKISRERVNELNFLGIVIFKSLVVIFNLVPVIALYIVKIPS